MNILDTIQWNMLPINNVNRPGIKLSRITDIAVHYVANPGTSALANRNYFYNCIRNRKSVSSHLIIGLNGEIVGCIPFDEISYCTNQANGYTISIECCHPDWTGKFTDKTYRSLVMVCAELIKKYNLGAGSVIRHYDVTGKVCPKNFVPKKHDGTDTNDEANWRKFKADVASAVNGSTATSNPVTETPKAESVTPTTNNSGIVDCDDFLVKVTYAALNIRKAAGTNSPTTGATVKRGEIFTITHTQFVGSSEWGKLKSGEGWINISNKYCSRVTQNEFKVKVICNVLNVRAGAGVNNKITTTVRRNQVYTIVETKKVGSAEWGKLKSGRGWINIGSAYVKRV